jgi:hypothetical protein
MLDMMILVSTVLASGSDAQSLAQTVKKWDVLKGPGIKKWAPLSVEWENRAEI